MSGKKVFVNYSEDFDNQYGELQKKVAKEQKQGITKSFHQQLLKSLDRTVDRLKIDPQFGVHIPHKYITKKVFETYGTKNIWKVNLPDYWRLLYSITGNHVEVIALILDMMDHDKYDKLFGYKKR